MGTASVIRRVRGKSRPPAGRSRGTPGQTQERTGRLDNNVFLKHRFLPLWNGKADAGREFFTSLSHLCNLYGWQSPDVSAFEFPQNVWQAYETVKQQCAGKKLDCMIIADEQHTATIVTAKRYDTGYTLYYLPIKPLWSLLTRAQCQPLAAALTQVTKYLCQVSGVGWCGDGSLIMSEYDTIAEWIEADEPEDENRLEQLKEIALFKRTAGKMDSLLKGQFKADDLIQAIAAYTKCPLYDTETGCLLTDFAAFCSDYPDKSVAQITGQFADCEETERIYLHEYLSCYWSSNGCLAEMLFDMLNSRFQECTVQDEPVSLQWFDTPQQSESHDFAFVERFFQLVSRLAQLLNDYEDEQYNEQL